MIRSRIILVVAGLGGAAALGILLGGTLAWMTVLTLLFTIVVPGALFVEGLTGRTEAAPEPIERIVLSIGAGYALALLLALLLSYIPGPQTRSMTFAAHLALLLVLTWWAMRPRLQAPEPAPDWQPILTPGTWRVALPILALILLLGTYLRIANLGYAEFHGDEARAALRAAAVIQGYDDVLFIHKKGPAEILYPTTVYSLTGRLTEFTARLPFTIANIAALLTVFVLGWRIAGPVAGGAAATLFAVDGYFVGFARIVQYQSIVLLTSALVILVLLRLTRDPRRSGRYLLLVGLFFTTGLLSHYEALLIGPPALLFLGLWWRRTNAAPRTVVASLVPATLVGATGLGLFYVPFFLHPNFLATYTYLAERRIGGQFPYNNISDFFLRTTVYNSTYYLVTLIGLLVALLLRLFWRSSMQHAAQPGRGLARWRARALTFALSAFLLLTLMATAQNPTWSAIGTADLLVVPFGLVLLAAFLMPAATTEIRALLLWFGPPMLAAFFFTLKPRTHVYTFFTPWLLLAGTAVAMAWQWLTTHLRQRLALVLGAGVALASVALFSYYIVLVFVRYTPEYLRHWESVRSPLYWTVYERPDDKALFGFPIQEGWKVIGELYRTGELDGPFETNDDEAWGPDWYTRGARRCLSDAHYLFLKYGVTPEIFLPGTPPDAWHLYGTVTVAGEPRLRIFERGPGSEEAPRTFDAFEWGRSFDAGNAGWDFFVGDTAVDPPIPNRLDYTLGDGIHLVGYGLDRSEVRPGETLELTLFWQADRKQSESYTVFTQVIGPDLTIHGQKDDRPLCGFRTTDVWDPGELITDRYRIPIRPDAQPGVYALIVGMYRPETGVRLDVVDQLGQPVDGNQIELTSVRIEPES